jgi:hypothetical protein
MGQVEQLAAQFGFDPERWESRRLALSQAKESREPSAIAMAKLLAQWRHWQHERRLSDEPQEVSAPDRAALEALGYIDAEPDGDSEEPVRSVAALSSSLSNLVDADEARRDFEVGFSLPSQVVGWQAARIHPRFGPIRGDFKAPAASPRAGGAVRIPSA